MTMLIRGGTIHTMTAQGTLTGDVLIEHGRIAAIGPELTLPDGLQPCTLSAKGLHVLPGLIDAHVRETPEHEEVLRRTAQSAGVTAALVWPEMEGFCCLMTAEGFRPSDVYRIQPDAYTDLQLKAQLTGLVADGCCPACEITSADMCRRILRIVEETGVHVIMVHLHGCDGLEDAVSRSGCPVILGVGRSAGGSPWALAARLDVLGTPVAVTCNHPEARLKHLPLCAALCVRDGMAPSRALHTVTAAPADLLGLPDAGRIAPDCRADLVLYDGDPLLLATAHVITIQDGKICH